MYKRLTSLCLLLVFTTSAIADLSMSYRRLLPLEGGSNFRDMGGYQTIDGRTVIRGTLFRSGAMAALTEADMAYLNQFEFRSVVDLRTNEEITLYPNRWAAESEIPIITGDYSFQDMMNANNDNEENREVERPVMSELYPRILQSIQPQLVRYFETALKGKVPMVVNCSAGQDRTGVTVALMLTLLGVPEQTVIEDYLLSTDFRRPAIEQAGVDLAEAAKTNAFAAMMLQYRKAMPHPDRPNPLVTTEGKPYLLFVFDYIKKNYGSIENYADQVLGINGDDLNTLRSRYLI